MVCHDVVGEPICLLASHHIRWYFDELHEAVIGRKIFVGLIFLEYD